MSHDLSHDLSDDLSCMVQTSHMTFTCVTQLTCMLYVTFTPDPLVEEEFNRLGMRECGQWKITEGNVEFKWVQRHLAHGL